MTPPTSIGRPLADAEWESLRVADRELRSAVADYDESIGRSAARESLDASQVRIEIAERELWHLREQLLGWSRPSWAPSASFMSDWFSDEDRVYDEIR